MHTIMHCCISYRISCLFKNSNRIEPVFAKNPNRLRTHNFEFFPISSNNLKFNKREIDILMLINILECILRYFNAIHVTTIVCMVYILKRKID